MCPQLALAVIVFLVSVIFFKGIEHQNTPADENIGNKLFNSKIQTLLKFLVCQYFTTFHVHHKGLLGRRIMADDRMSSLKVQRSSPFSALFCQMVDCETHTFRDGIFNIFEGIDDNIPTHVMGFRDIQGILWERLNIIRESYGLTRLAQYRNYENILLPGDVNPILCSFESPTMDELTLAAYELVVRRKDGDYLFLYRSVHKTAVQFVTVTKH
ncbi:hypothetical protein CTI12_AA474690 [Artemisia annua]|uniref:Uncharacterized protein n=1 Tax=Artemisia annua TaxID=35608 RepID=A0A2U1LMU5_ARTAN|nr:hypothetical protein CTI12_AA474690 [Artemisia annua]